MSGFEETKSRRMIEDQEEVLTPEVLEGGLPKKKDNEQTSISLEGAVAQNFDKILGLASEIVSIKKMKEQSEADIKKMDKAIQMLEKQTKDYVEKSKADTDRIVAKMNMIRYMMQDFYKQSNQQITGAEFQTIITSIIDKMSDM